MFYGLKCSTKEMHSEMSKKLAKIFPLLVFFSKIIAVAFCHSFTPDLARVTLIGFDYQHVVVMMLQS
jgi:hypothetical protein